MLSPEAEQFVVQMALWAIVVGVMAGFVFSRLLEKLLDVVLYRIVRSERIEQARKRDHAAVPDIKRGLQERMYEHFTGDRSP